uniref:Uncharacterized protein n=1 Tax=Anolis carolinensis TaxID=28377 RepID=A0A803TQM0_ANOCA
SASQSFLGNVLFLQTSAFTLSGVVGVLAFERHLKPGTNPDLKNPVISYCRDIQTCEDPDIWLETVIFPHLEISCFCLL